MNITKKITKIFVLAIFTIIILASNTKVFGVFEKKIGEIEYFKQSDLYTNAFYCLDETTLIPKTGDIKIPYRLVGYFEVDTSKQSNPVTSKGSVKLKTSYDSGYGNSFENCALGMAFAFPRLMEEDDNYIKKIYNGKLIDTYDWESKGWDMYKANNYAQNIIWSIHGMDTHLNREGWLGTVIETYYYDNLETIKNRKSIRVKDKGLTISDKSKFKGLIFKGTDLDGNDKIDENNYTIIGPFTYQASKGDYINKVEVKYNGNTVTLGKESNDDILLASRVDGSDLFKNGIVITTGKENPTSIFDQSINILMGKTGIYTTLTSSTGTIKNGYKPEFYILVKNGTNITKIDEIKLEIGRDQAKGRFEYYKYAKGEKWSDGKVRSAGDFVNKNGKWYKGDESQEGASGEFKTWIERHYIKFEDISLTPPVNLTLNKVNSLDLEGNELYNIPNIPFNIKFEQDGKEIYNKDVTTGKDGKVKIENVIPNSQNDITVTITEKKDIDGDGYKVLSEPLVITLQCVDGKYWKEKDGAGKLSGGEKYVVNYNTNATIGLTVKLENKSIIEKLTLSKASSVKDGEKVEGAKFKLTLTNIASIKNYQVPTLGATQDVPKTIYVETDENGNIVLEDIEIADLSKDIVITIEEIEAPVGYKKIEGTITVKLERKGDKYTKSVTEKDSTVTEDEFKAGEVTLINHELVLNIKDIPIMNLGGIVWTEKIKTGKEQSNINNTYSEGDDEALGGVTVRLLNEKNEVVATTKTAEKDGQEVTYLNNLGKEGKVTLNKGQYLFTKLKDGTNYIPVGTDYKVEIDYDGITYNPLINPDTSMLYKNKEENKGVFSKITSEDDHGLADGTKTIRGTENDKQSTTNGGYTINYTLQDEENIPDKAIYSNVEKDGDQVFVTARSEKYLQKTDDWKTTWKGNNGVGEIDLDSYAFDINFGLYKKFFDLNLGTDVEKAEVEINGQKTEYDYDQILNGMLDEDLREKLYKTTDDKADYNLYLAYSDYYYRIDDYKVPGSTESLGQPYGEALTGKKDTDTQLQVYVTYKLQINNQSTQHKATGVKVKYSYDEGYEYVESNGEATVSDEGHNILTISNINNVVSGEPKEITLKFKVKKNKDGTFVKAPSDTSKYTNVAEIVEYSTTEGRLVDADSAPGNTFLGENKPTDRREDDTDTANGIVITFKKNAERSISGKVFEDSDKNSTQNGEEQAINDVIVQLIELVESNNKQYEYIWQETVAGSKTVKTTATSGNRGATYEVTDNKAGEYKFTQGIIPGNYIVRFIYGDGSTYDIKENTLKYNGEDYKSTYVDYNYNAEWYNDTSLNGENSKAVDNEARRLKVMSYAVDVDGTKGAELALLSKPIGTDDDKLKAVLDKTWMCAETLKIKVPVDPSVLVNENGEKEEKLSITENSTSVKKADSQYKVTFDNVNLGLMERPKTKLVLEKHITGLTIKPVASGVNLIANATADINKILDQGEGDQIQLEGQKDGLFAQKSGRTNRGLWYLQTDTTELAQGADAYITYTYVIKNEGDEDYLNEDLIALYENDINGYVNKLSDLETEVKNAKKQVTAYTNGTYISNFYYTGHATGKDKKVLASVEQIQEALNPKVTFVNSTTDFSKTDRDPSIRYAYYDVEGNKEENNANIKEIITITQGTKTKKLLQTGETLGTTTSDKNKFINDTMDTSKKLVVSVGLSASEIENGGVYDSYIAQVTHYTNAAGRRDQSTPANLSYVHSEDPTITLDSENPATNKKYNEQDEFWAETFRITKPTGEDKITPVQIAIITISAVAVLGVEIILIKKFVLKK